MDHQSPGIHREIWDPRGEVRGGDGVGHRLRTCLDQLVDLCVCVCVYVCVELGEEGNYYLRAKSAYHLLYELSKKFTNNITGVDMSKWQVTLAWVRADDCHSGQIW